MADTKGSATSFAATASQPLVSVITRTHNRHLLLRRAIESVLGQTYASWQHIIVNDGADAAALDEFLKPFAARYNGRLIVVHNPKSLGMQAATNAGLAKATGTFVAIHDDDDSWHEEYLAATVAFLEEKGPDSIYQGVISHTVRVLEDIDAQGQVVEVERKPYQPFNEVNLFRVGYENPFPPIAFLYRRSAHGVIGLFDQRYDFVGDMDFNIRFLLRWEIGVVQRPLAYYHWRRKGGADYNNTVTTQTNLHELRFNELMNESLRKAAGNDGAGFGVALNVGRQAVMSVERLGDIKTHLNSITDSISGDALPRMSDLKAHLSSVSAILSGMIAELRDVRAVEETLRSSDAAIDSRIQRVEITCEALHQSVSTLNDTLAQMRAESARWREESLLREKEREQGFHIGPFRMRWRRWSKSKS